MTSLTARAKGEHGPGAGVAATRRLLEGLYLELAAEVDEATAAAHTAGSLADRSGEDEIDTGSRTSQREQQIGVLANIQARQAQVERALQRIDAGTYGRCETCGSAIAPERLEAFPSVTSCVACKGSARPGR
jgi:DnaK suppressor protein